jgi:iron complex outermembrane receptor protein
VGRSWGDADNSFQAAGFTLFDGALDYTRERWRFAVNARNIGNRRYVDGCYSSVDCAYGAARTVVGSTTFTF